MLEDGFHRQPVFFDEKAPNPPPEQETKKMEPPSQLGTPQARDPAARFGSGNRRSRSRSLPNLTFSHRRYRSQPAAALNELPGVTRQNSLKSVFKVQKSLKRRRLHQNNMSFNGMDTELVQLPPVNIDSLKEIDLQEILKNPQLRHDILFDPQLQFRPNLDGERGRRKKMVVDKYWSEVEQECKEYRKLLNKIMLNQGSVNVSGNLIKFQYKYLKLPLLFKTLRDILILLLPLKEKLKVYDVMDVDLYTQQLRKGVVEFVSLAKWLSGVFKSYCAPMRDAWVDEMTQKFVEAGKENLIKKLIDGLRTVFSILEAMKLDVANHQIRVLRPALVETAVDFERDYFSQMLGRKKLNIQDLFAWYSKEYKKESAKSPGAVSGPNFGRNVAVSAVIRLLLCREMTLEFPLLLLFDHLRLILLRADVRQLVCLQICLYLYKQLVLTYAPDSCKGRLVSRTCLNDVKREIMAVITDENGNVKWTRNIPAIAIQLAKRAALDPQEPISTPPPALVVSFAHLWLIKQTQPSSDVYGLMEERVFAQLKSQIVHLLDNHKAGVLVGMKAGSPSSSTTPITPTPATPTLGGQLSDEIQSLAMKLSVLINFHWSVFGSHYLGALDKY